MKEKQIIDSAEHIPNDTEMVNTDEVLQQKKHHKLRRTIFRVMLGSFLALLIGGGVYLYWILNRPEAFFKTAEANVTTEPRKELMEPAFDLSAYEALMPEPTKAAQMENIKLSVTVPDADPIPTPLSITVPNANPVSTPTPLELTEAAETVEPSAAVSATDSAQKLYESLEIKDNIVNILLMGIDALESGKTTSGSQVHTDVMMVVAVNFDKNTVDLITLPRDTFTTAPKYNGFYKLNGIFNVGGGMKKKKNGFALTCQAAEIWLGGITIPYYYVLDFQAVVDVVDAIGGIDYDVDQPFRENVPEEKSMVVGKYYNTGMHHLDGNAVLGYLRARKSADNKDSSRTARQRRMMVAIYNKLKTEGKLSQIPDLVNAASSGIYTNTTLSQTAALVNYAINHIEQDQIRTRTLSGQDLIQHYWKFHFVDQQNRLDIIKEVYGIDAESIGMNTPQYENWLYDIGFKTIKHIRQPEKIFKVIKEEKAAGTTFTEKQIEAYAACYQAYTALDEAFTACSERLQKAYVDPSLTKKEIKALEAEVKTQLVALNKTVKSTTTALAQACSISTKLAWDPGEKWFKDTDINEKYVNFN